MKKHNWLDKLFFREETLKRFDEERKVKQQEKEKRLIEYGIFQSIYQKYSQTNLYGGDFNGLNKKGKLLKLTEIIKNDNQISTMMNDKGVKRWMQETSYGGSCGVGTSLFIRDGDLWLYHFDYNQDYEEPADLDELMGWYGVTADELKKYIMDYSAEKLHKKR